MDDDSGIGFQDMGASEVADKGDPVLEKMRAEVVKKVTKEGIEAEVRQETGTEKTEAKGNFTKDVPQLAFRIIGDVIECPKFRLDDDEAAKFAYHLNILLPLDGKIASLVVLLMITLNKVYVCLDAIKRKFAKPGDAADGLKQKENLPEPLA
jgi:hypothetical protein